MGAAEPAAAGELHLAVERAQFVNILRITKVHGMCATCALGPPYAFECQGHPTCPVLVGHGCGVVLGTIQVIGRLVAGGVADPRGLGAADGLLKVV